MKLLYQITYSRGTAVGLRAKMITADFQSESGRKNCVMIARQIAREG